MLGYRLVDEELPTLIAARLGTSAEIVRSMEDREPRFAERLMASLSAAMPETTQPAAVPADDIRTGYRREAERLVAAAADEGRVVILGRLAGTILGARRDVLRAFLGAPLDWRVANVSASLSITAAQARTEIQRIDEARRAYAREAYGIAWGERAHYHLTVDVSRYGVEGSAEVLAAAVRAAEHA